MVDTYTSTHILFTTILSLRISNIISSIDIKGSVVDFWPCMIDLLPGIPKLILCSNQGPKDLERESQ